MNSYYLNKISEFQKIFKPYNFTVKVGGGFAIDGFLQRETREHSDLDLDVVGNVSWEGGFEILKRITSEKFQAISEKREHLEIIDGENKIGVGKLGSLVFDVENPSMIFAIKYLMPISGKKKIREKDYKDIENLLPHLPKKELLLALKFQLEYIGGRKVCCVS